MAKEEFDYIVVGGGVSRCVVVAKLVADGNKRVALLEGGYSNRHPLLDMPQGNVLGGGSSVNAQVYMR